MVSSVSDLVPKPPTRDLALAGPVIDWSRLSGEARETLAGFTYARATLRTYESAWRGFLRWSEDRGQPSLPASPYDLAEYLDYLGRQQRVDDRGHQTPTSVSRIEVAVAAVACAHALAGLPFDRGHDALRKMLRALRRKLGLAPRHQKQPLVAELLERVCEPLGDSLIDIRDRALLVVGFLSACRRSNLAALDVEHLRETKDGLDVHLTRSKTDQEGRGGDVALPLQGDPRLDPVHVVRAWRSAARIETGPLFRSVDRWGRVGERLAGQEVCRIVQRRINAAKMDGIDGASFGAHSMRSGLCTSAAENGASIDAIMAITGHRRADSVLRYIRRANRFRNNAGSGLLGRKCAAASPARPPPRPTFAAGRPSGAPTRRRHRCAATADTRSPTAATRHTMPRAPRRPLGHYGREHPLARQRHRCRHAQGLGPAAATPAAAMSTTAAEPHVPGRCLNAFPSASACLMAFERSPLVFSSVINAEPVGAVAPLSCASIAAAVVVPVE